MSAATIVGTGDTNLLENGSTSQGNGGTATHRMDPYVWQWSHKENGTHHSGRDA